MNQLKIKNLNLSCSSGKFLMLLSMFYAIILSVSGLYTYRPIFFHDITFSTSDLIYPFSYVLSDIICEIYGYVHARRLIWFGLMSCFLFAVITTLADHLPYPLAYHAKAAAYNAVLGSYVRLTFAGLCSMVLGEFLNAIVITKWRIMSKGRWFWLRSIGSTSIGAAIDTLIEYVVAFFGLVSMGVFFKWLFFAYLFRIIYAGVMGGPATFVVFILRKYEKLDFSGAGKLNFNPFKLEE